MRVLISAACAAALISSGAAFAAAPPPPPALPDTAPAPYPCISPVGVYSPCPDDMPKPPPGATAWCGDKSFSKDKDRKRACYLNGQVTVFLPAIDKDDDGGAKKKR